MRRTRASMSRIMITGLVLLVLSQAGFVCGQQDAGVWQDLCEGSSDTVYVPTHALSTFPHIRAKHRELLKELELELEERSNPKSVDRLISSYQRSIKLRKLMIAELKRIRQDAGQARDMVESWGAPGSAEVDIAKKEGLAFSETEVMLLTNRDSIMDANSGDIIELEWPGFLPSMARARFESQIELIAAGETLFLKGREFEKLMEILEYIRVNHEQGIEELERSLKRSKVFISETEISKMVDLYYIFDKCIQLNKNANLADNNEIDRLILNKRRGNDETDNKIGNGHDGARGESSTVSDDNEVKIHVVKVKKPKR